MSKRLLLPLLLLWLAGCGGCLGIEFGNPEGNEKGGGDPPIGGGSHPKLVLPSRLTLPPTCPGGVSRIGFEAGNDSSTGLTVTAETDATAEIHPSIARIPAETTVRLGLVVYVDAKRPVGSETGEFLLVPHGEKSARVTFDLQIVDDGLPRAALLCGAEAPCETVDLRGNTESELTVVNDGCAPLTLQAIEFDDTAIEWVGPIAFPLEMAPGDRVEARLLPLSVGRSGYILVRSDQGELQLPWRS